MPITKFASNTNSRVLSRDEAIYWCYLNSCKFSLVPYEGPDIRSIESPAGWGWLHAPEEFGRLRLVPTTRVPKVEGRELRFVIDDPITLADVEAFDVQDYLSLKKKDDNKSKVDLSFRDKLEAQIKALQERSEAFDAAIAELRGRVTEVTEDVASAERWIVAHDSPATVEKEAPFVPGKFEEWWIVHMCNNMNWKMGRMSGDDVARMRELMKLAYEVGQESMRPPTTSASEPAPASTIISQNVNY